MNLSDVFEQCALVVAHGWWNGKQQFGDQECASTAMVNVCVFHNRLYIEACAVFIRAIGGNKVTDIYDWNDAPGRTQAEVVAMFQALAATERARERLLPVCQSAASSCSAVATQD